MALDESKHFSLLSARLTALGTPYGSLPVHSALWVSALRTAHSLRARLAIIHLVHEARGLDVNPATIEKFRKAGDKESTEVLEVIHADEVTHVTTGHRWFTWLCARQSRETDGPPLLPSEELKAGEIGVDPVLAFREEVRVHFDGGLKGPFNEADRRRAGLTRDFYEGIDGEVWKDRGAAGSGVEEVHGALAKVSIGYG
jgi:uncharacterized ferritin-like protein (DUF455 family)